MKIEIFPPQKKDVIIYDYIHSWHAQSFLPKNIKFDVLYTRLEKINLSVFLITLLKFKFKYKDYFQTYINFCNPKLIITFCDNDLRFYQINRKNLKKISIQNGRRSKVLDMFNLKNNYPYFNLSCDYICVHNFNVGNLYKEIIKTKILALGSFFSNRVSINKIKKNYITYISCFKPSYLTDEVLCGDIKYTYLKNEDVKILKNLKNYIKKNNETLKIIAKSGNEKFLEEKKFYYKIFGKQNVEVIKNKGHENSFKITDQSKLVIGNDSTMAFECFARGSKVLFIYRFASKKEIFKSKVFFCPNPAMSEGPFWINDGNYFKIDSKIKKLIKLSNKEWSEINFQYKKKIMCFDKNNEILKNKIRKLLFS